MLEEIESQLLQGNDIEDILEKHDWKKFESAIAEIFQENGFKTKQNFRFKTKRRYEIDVIAVKGGCVLCVDCKWWGKGRYKASGLKNAVVSQEERVLELRKFLKKNHIAKTLLRLNSGYTVYPLLATLHDEMIVKDSDTFVVPVWKLNKFINETF